MLKKVLVTYATRGGTTVGIAQCIAKTLAANGFEVDVMPVLDVKTVAPYDAVVAGSAIQYSQWLPEAVQFVKTHQHALSQKPFAVFLTCMALAMSNTDKQQASALAWITPVRQLVTPISEGAFAGMADFNKLPVNPVTFALRLLSIIGVFPKDDRRDWQAVERWAGQLATRF